MVNLCAINKFLQGRHHHGGQAARRPHMLCSICGHSFGALAKAVRLLTASTQSQKMSYQTLSVDIFVDLKPFICNLKGRLLDPPVWGSGRTWWSAIGSFDIPPMGFYLFHIDIYGFSITVFELFRRLQKHFRPSNSDTRTTTAREPIALPSSKN